MHRYVEGRVQSESFTSILAYQELEVQLRLMSLHKTDHAAPHTRTPLVFVLSTGAVRSFLLSTSPTRTTSPSSGILEPRLSKAGARTYELEDICYKLYQRRRILSHALLPPSTIQLHAALNPDTGNVEVFEKQNFT
mmetsp:Transcript_42186/g.164850  ORF Transcript_42186/g.164850 Transcript_42186/m.164850 type:complete len:136 (-) Transcript_42186:46-453(-)